MTQRMHRRERGERSGERGSVLIFTVIGMLAFALISGLAFDISRFYLVKTEMQNAADAAALAGASALNTGSSGIDLAVDRAVRILRENKYDFNKKPVVRNIAADLASLTGDTSSCASASCKVSIRFGATLASLAAPGSGLNKLQAKAAAAAATTEADEIKFIKVEAETPSDSPVTVVFARRNIESGQTILGATKTIPATATAGWSVPLNYICNIAPFTVIQCDGTSPAGCTLAPPVGQGQHQSPGTVYHRSGSVCSSQTEFTKGCLYTVLGGPGSPAPGNFRLLNLCQSASTTQSDCVITSGGGQANCTREAAASSSGQCRRICAPGTTGADCQIDVQTGLDTGQVVQGLNVRFDDYGGGAQQLAPRCYPPDTNINEGPASGSGIDYETYLAGLNYGTTGNVPPRTAHRNLAIPTRREITVPITPIGQYAGQSGTHFMVTPAKYGVFFMRKQARQGGGQIQIELEFVSYASPGAGGAYVGGGGGDPSFRVPVIYR